MEEHGKQKQHKLLSSKCVSITKHFYSFCLVQSGDLARTFK